MAHGLYQPKPMPWPMPPGNYTLLQGIASYIRIVMEGKDDINDPDVVCIEYGNAENPDRIHTEPSGLRNRDVAKSCARFAELPVELRDAVLARFRELFALEHPPVRDSPRSLRTRHYLLNPTTITVLPRETNDNATQDAQQSQAVQVG